MSQTELFRIYPNSLLSKFFIGIKRKRGSINFPPAPTFQKNIMLFYLVLRYSLQM